MGLERVERLQKEYNVEVEWKAFELRPDTPPGGIPRPFKPGESNELRGHMKEAADEAGLVYMRRQPITPYCRPSMEAAVYAREMGKFDGYHKATFKAFWEESKDIGDPEVIKGIFEKCDLDWDGFSSPEKNGQYAQMVEDQLAEARMYGITGVPAFILDRYLVVGAQPYQVFQQVMAHIEKEKALKGLWLPGQGAER
ncbi:MAG: hypothetical protein EXR53_00315 [Dehalococcoidia bacterium]|nr:hypothetical protein [Dehalococcoidia bacterium]